MNERVKQLSSQIPKSPVVDGRHGGHVVIWHQLNLCMFPKTWLTLSFISKFISAVRNIVVSVFFATCPVIEELEV